MHRGGALAGQGPAPRVLVARGLDASARFVTFEEGTHGSPTTCLVTDADVQEVRLWQPSHGSWFVGDTVVPQRGVYLASPLDPLLLLLPTLERAQGGSLLSLEDLLSRFYSSGAGGGAGTGGGGAASALGGREEGGGVSPTSPRRQRQRRFEIERSTSDNDAWGADWGADWESGREGAGDDGRLAGSREGGSRGTGTPVPATAAAPHGPPPASSASLPAALSVLGSVDPRPVCEWREVNGSVYVRLDGCKLGAWLAIKARRAAAALRAADPAGWAGFPPEAALEAGISLLREWCRNEAAWSQARAMLGLPKPGGDAGARAGGTDEAVAGAEARGTGALGGRAEAGPDAHARAAEAKRPGAAIVASKEQQASAKRAATKEAKRAQQAAGTRKLSGFFLPKKPS